MNTVACFFLRCAGSSVAVMTAPFQHIYQRTGRVVSSQWFTHREYHSVSPRTTQLIAAGAAIAVTTHTAGRLEKPHGQGPVVLGGASKQGGQSLATRHCVYCSENGVQHPQPLSSLHVLPLLVTARVLGCFKGYIVSSEGTEPCDLALRVVPWSEVCAVPTACLIPAGTAIAGYHSLAAALTKPCARCSLLWTCSGCGCATDYRRCVAPPCIASLRIAPTLLLTGTAAPLTTVPLFPYPLPLLVRVPLPLPPFSLPLLPLTPSPSFLFPSVFLPPSPSFLFLSLSVLPFPSFLFPCLSLPASTQPLPLSPLPSSPSPFIPSRSPTVVTARLSLAASLTALSSPPPPPPPLT